MAPKNNYYPLIVWNIEDKQLVKEILTIVRKNSMMRKDIWPYGRENSRRKFKISYFKIFAKKLFQNEPLIKNYFEEEEAVTYYWNIMKTQVVWIKNRLKITKITLTITEVCLLYKNNIHKRLYIMDK